MNIDKTSFLVIVSSLAVGGAGGYVASEKRLLPPLDKSAARAPEPVAPEPALRAMPVADAAPSMTAAPPPPLPAAPTCDDSTGTAGDCPGPGFPTVEGGCGSFATIRCAEMKQSMKPKVAQTAVLCLAKLTPQERCDPARVVLCGHLAYMNACLEQDPAPSTAAGAGSNAIAMAGDGGAGGGAKSTVASACQAIIDGCGASPIAPSMAECKQLLSGMTDTGRERTRACMKAHCFDRGLVGCEGTNPGK